MPEGVLIPEDQRVLIGEVEAFKGVPDPDERTALLSGNDDSPAGGGEERATDDTV